ncbi:hypothetical protein E3N88_24222 [Mikania micrantha]|uniref:Uncharacterized protein n=1 Tax=Mikania micrantha TaxID=192012 RepID=A0A5N6NFF5_9ASTR|nr:hypothetical protein E3N88_24222 [Mikania micrantha]
MSHPGPPGLVEGATGPIRIAVSDHTVARPTCLVAYVHPNTWTKQFYEIRVAEYRLIASQYSYIICGFVPKLTVVPPTMSITRQWQSVLVNIAPIPTSSRVGLPGAIGGACQDQIVLFKITTLSAPLY